MDGATQRLMALVNDIGAAYKNPRREMRRQIADGIREEQTLFFALLFGGLSFLSLLPEIAKEAFITDGSLSAMAAAQFIASVFMMPLLMYGIAAISRIVLARFNGQGDHVGARRALFWAGIVAAPAMLLSAAIAIYVPSLQLITGVVTMLIFFWQWFANLKELEFGDV